MKLWRKLAKKQYDINVGGVVRNGRQIKYAHQMQEYIFNQQPKMYPLLARLFVHSGIAVVAPVESVNEAN